MKYILTNNLSIVCLLIVSQFTLSCSSDDNTPQPNNEFYNSIKGEWNGIYSGGDSGSWKGTISETGNFSGTVQSTSLNVSFSLEGKVSTTGNLEADYTYNGTKIGSFLGNITGNDISGTWTNEQSNLNGVFNGNKQ